MESNFLTYATVCSGIECMSVACRGLPLKPVFFSEIEPFPCAVLKANYPTIPNLGDMSKIRRDENGNITNGTTTIPFPDGGIDILAGGTPCQDVSVAGKRAGMQEGSGTRSSLAFDFVRLARELGPRYIIWENVAGSIDSKNAPDFLRFAAALGDCGYTLAWRVLDAQYVRVDGMERAVPQRRRRVWVVGCLGADESVPAQILFESDCVAGHTAPRRRTGEGFAYSLAGRDRVDAGVVGGAPRDGGGKASAPARGGQGQSAEHGGVGDGGHPRGVRHDGGGREGEAGGVGDGGCEVLNFQGSKGNNCVTNDGSCPNLNAMHGHDVHVVALDGDKLKPREGQRKGGNGFGINEDGAGYTLTGVDRHGVAYETHADGVTLDAKNGFPIADGVSQSLIGGTAPGHKNAVVSMAREDCAPTVQNREYKGGMSVVQCYENNSLNHSEVCRTLTGNHDDRVTDTGTSVVISMAQNTRDEVRIIGGDGQIAGALPAEPGMNQQTFVTIVREGAKGE